MTTVLDSLAVAYSTDAFVEPKAGAARGGATGLVGRQLAAAQFLDAYLRHGAATTLVGVVPDRDAIAAFEAMWKAHPAVKPRGRKYHLVGTPLFHRNFLDAPPARLLHLPGPLDANLAWARLAHAPDAFALSGLVPTLSTVAATQAFAQLLAAPFEEYDTLVCPSEAARACVNAVVEATAAHLRQRLGGDPKLRPRLEVIPPGVDAARFAPPPPADRAKLRADMQVSADEVVVLYVGRLSFHAAANPYPIYHGLYQAARATGRKVRLLLAGTTSNDHVHRAFHDGARIFAPTVHVQTVDLLVADLRSKVWHVADVFTTMPDNVHESQAQAVLAAMAAGLPVVASDWGSARELVVPGETGLLVPTAIVGGAGSNLPTRLLVKEIADDAFLAATSQTVAVELPAAVAAYTRMLADPEASRRLGEAGRRRVLERFTWDKVIAAYDRLWLEQEAVRAAKGPREKSPRGPEVTFAPLASRIVGEDDVVRTAADHETQMLKLMKVAMTSYAPEARTGDPLTLRAVLNAAKKPVAVRELDAVLRQAGVPRQTARATIAWMLKYGLLELVPAARP